MTSFKDAKLTRWVLPVVILTAMLAGCDGKTPGTVLNIYGTEATRGTTKCDTGDWSISVQKKDGKIANNCVSAETAAKYKVGDQYP